MVILMSVALLAGCVAGAESPIEVQLEQDFQLRPGQSAYVATVDLTVGFEGVASDSRCPRGEACVWEGDATVRIRLRQADGTVDILELHTRSGGQSAQSIGGYSVRLVAVLPEPVKGVEPTAAGYAAILQVSSAPASGESSF